MPNIWRNFDFCAKARRQNTHAITTHARDFLVPRILVDFLYRMVFKYMVLKYTIL